MAALRRDRTCSTRRPSTSKRVSTQFQALLRWPTTANPPRIQEPSKALGIARLACLQCIYDSGLAFIPKRLNPIVALPDTDSRIERLIDVKRHTTDTFDVSRPIICICKFHNLFRIIVKILEPSIDEIRPQE